ncbi:MAG: DUF2169 domain-containing protein [Deltaproteobacteria bacterium]|nr:DUF2169 domain-containing protein [Deltaproteobacteria bacterium]
MEVVSLCPLRVATVTWRPSPHRLALTLICKATFRLEPDLSPLHRSQQAPCRKDQHWKGEPGRSLYAPTDLVPAKPRADVLLVGRARAPEAVPRASIVTRLHVGEIDKSIEAFGARFFLPGGRLVQAAKIAELPLRYEAAAGGPGTPNPVGIARSARDAQGRLVVPNLQPAGLRVAAPGDVVPSVGYGPIAPSWPARAAKLGPCAALFEADRWWATALPDGLDPSYFNAAPQDQQVSELHPDEEIDRRPLLRAHDPRRV